MQIDKIIKKAMIDSDISGAIGLMEATGLSKAKCYRLMQGDKTIRLVDFMVAIECLGYELTARIQ